MTNIQDITNNIKEIKDTFNNVFNKDATSLNDHVELTKNMATTPEIIKLVREIETQSKRSNKYAESYKEKTGLDLYNVLNSPQYREENNISDKKFTIMKNIIDGENPNELQNTITRIAAQEYDTNISQHGADIIRNSLYRAITQDPTNKDKIENIVKDEYDTYFSKNTISKEKNLIQPVPGEEESNLQLQPKTTPYIPLDDEGKTQYFSI